MKILVGGRKCGKTTRLLYESEKTGFPMLVLNDIRATELKERARELGIVLPEPVVLKSSKVQKAPAVMVDDALLLLELLIREQMNAVIHTATIDSPIEVMEYEMPFRKPQYLSEISARDAMFEKRYMGKWIGGVDLAEGGDFGVEIVPGERKE